MAAARSVVARSDSGKAMPGQVARVLVALIDGRDAIGVAAPQHGRMTVPCDQGRQRGAPGAGAENRDVRAVA